MTTEKLIKLLNGLDTVQADLSVNGRFIWIKNVTGNESSEASLLKLSIEAYTWAGVEFIESPLKDYLGSVIADKVAYLVEEYLQTPIEQRNPKKKYALAWRGDDNGKSNYFVKHNGSWFLVPQKGDEFPEEALFTQKELDQIGERCFYMKPVIEALKVEV